MNPLTIATLVGLLLVVIAQQIAIAWLLDQRRPRR